jgi:ABC-type Zn2+ transport system substrate-binding protein/surface adhesin
MLKMFDINTVLKSPEKGVCVPGNELPDEIKEMLAEQAKTLFGEPQPAPSLAETVKLLNIILGDDEDG